MKDHQYDVTVTWTGNTGTGTSAYSSYQRNHEIKVKGKPVILASSDPLFRGDKTRYNPEELLVVSLSSCHMLWYLHLCAVAGVIVVEYTDNAEGTMREAADGSGHFIEVTLRPVITLADSSMRAKADAQHAKANKMCFIANSCNFPVHHKPVYQIIHG